MKTSEFVAKLEQFFKDELDCRPTIQLQPIEESVARGLGSKEIKEYRGHSIMIEAKGIFDE